MSKKNTKKTYSKKQVSIPEVEVDKKNESLKKDIVKKDKVESKRLKHLGYVFIALIFIVSIIVIINDANRGGYTEINYTVLEQKLERNDSFVLFIGRTTCSACSTFKEILNAQYNKEKSSIAIFYIDLDNLSDEEIVKFNTNFDWSATPTTIIVTNGKVESYSIDKFEGADKYSSLISRLKSKGYIKG